MKPCMGWNACGEPLGYAFIQYQTIPFMVLGNLIRLAQETKYKIKQLLQKSEDAKYYEDHYDLRRQANLYKHTLQRYENLIKHTELTCNAVMRDLSLPHYDEPLNQKVIKKYREYVEKPISRTIDMINNNSSFLGQLYTVIKTNML